MEKTSNIQIHTNTIFEKVLDLSEDVGTKRKLLFLKYESLKLILMKN